MGIKRAGERFPALLLWWRMLPTDEPAGQEAAADQQCAGTKRDERWGAHTARWRQLLRSSRSRSSLGLR